MKSANLFGKPFEEIFGHIRNDIPGYEYDYTRHMIKLLGEKEEEIASLRLPLHLTISKSLLIENEEAEILYLSIESGSAALILKEGKKTVFHKTMSAYMSRKKQGFSQIKYLNKKGKSRAGSRVRLAATTEFFENINSVTTEILENREVSRIALNCNKTLIPYLFQSKIPPPFEKKDPRLYKIPLHVPKSNTTQLEAVIKKLIAPMLFYLEDKESQLESLLITKDGK
jgi:hypothetical protein